MDEATGSNYYGRAVTFKRRGTDFLGRDGEEEALELDREEFRWGINVEMKDPEKDQQPETTRTVLNI